MKLDPKILRFLALLSAPLFTLLRVKLDLDIPESTQDLLIASVIAYILGSHGKEAIVARASAAAVVASGKVTPGADADAVVDAAAQAKS